jgi:hypothetical protein
MFDSLHQFGNATLGTGLWLVVWSIIKIVALVLPLMGCVAYLTLWERKAIGWTQIRPGPNRVGPFGLLTPIADAVKLIFKEIIRPTAASNHAGAGRLGRDSVRSGRGARQRRCRSAVHDGHHVDGCLRRDHRRLGVQFEVRLPRQPAFGGADRCPTRSRWASRWWRADGVAEQLNLSDIVRG